MKKIIGVYGLICSGKSTFAKLLAKEIDAVYINADDIGHEALLEKKHEIVALFSDKILDNNGNIDRKLLGKIVFSNKKKLKSLESISHPFINEKIKKIISNTDKSVIIDAALLIRSNLHNICDITIYVDSKVSDIIKRMKYTRHIEEKEARKRIKFQNDVKIKKFNADIIIKNMRDYNRLVMISKQIGRHYESNIISKYRRKTIFR